MVFHWPTSLLCFTALLHSTIATSSCYLPDGTIDFKHKPCNTSAEQSACCGATDACLSNGYCFQQYAVDQVWNNRLARGTCTDKTWASDACPQFCSDVYPYQTVSVVLVQDQRAGGFCCGTGFGVAYNTTTQQCLQTTLGTNDPFELPAGQVIFDRATGATVGNSTVATITATAKPSPNIGPVVIGTVVPLVVLLLIAVATVVLLLKRSKALERLLKEQGQTGDALGYSNNASVPRSLRSLGSSNGYHSVWAKAWEQPKLHEMGTDRRVCEVPGSLIQR
jgi:hypothetical protein